MIFWYVHGHITWLTLSGRISKTCSLTTWPLSCMLTQIIMHTGTNHSPSHAHYMCRLHYKIHHILRWEKSPGGERAREREREKKDVACVCMCICVCVYAVFTECPGNHLYTDTAHQQVCSCECFEDYKCIVGCTLGHISKVDKLKEIQKETINTRKSAYAQWLYKCICWVTRISLFSLSDLKIYLVHSVCPSNQQDRNTYQVSCSGHHDNTHHDK